MGQEPKDSGSRAAEVRVAATPRQRPAAHRSTAVHGWKGCSQASGSGCRPWGEACGG